MTCRDYEALLIDYTHGELDAALDAQVYEHLQSCADCRARWQAELDLTDSVRHVYSEQLDMPMSIVANVRQAMRGERAPSFLDRLSAALRPAIVAPAAAVLLIVAGVLHFSNMLRPVPELSSSYFVRQHIVQTLGSPASERAWAAYLLTSENTKNDTGAP